MQTRHSQRTARGALYITALFMTSIVAMAVLVNLTRSLTQVRAAELFVDNTQAFHTAEAGIDEAILELSSGGTDLSVNFSQAEGWADAGSGQCATGETCSRTVQLMGSSATVTVNDIAASEPVITATGSLGQGRQTVEVVVSLPTLRPFQWAFFSEKDITLDKNGLVDSYNSSLGGYGATIAPNPTYGTLNKSDAANPASWNGDLRTESVQNDKLEVRQDSVVFGDATVGVGGDPALVIKDDGATIHGSQSAAASSVTLKSVKLPSGSVDETASDYSTSNESESININSCNCKSLTVSEDTTLTLTGTGTLHLNRIDVKDGATLQIDSPDMSLVVNGLKVEKEGTSFTTSATSKLKLYGTGQSSMVFEKGNIVNASQDPSKLKILVNGSNAFTIKKDGTFYGAIYAPDAEVKIDKDAKLFGSIASEKLTIDKDADFHYDEYLATVPIDVVGGSVDIQSWRQP